LRALPADSVVTTRFEHPGRNRHPYRQAKGDDEERSRVLREMSNAVVKASESRKMTGLIP